MRISKTLQLSFNMFLHSKLRSWLTILGIVIGVTAVVAIVSIGQGMQASVQSQISGLGQDILTITAGGGRAIGGFDGGQAVASSTVSPLSSREVNALKLVPGILSIYPIVSGRATVYYNAESTSASITGADTTLFSQYVTTSLASGRYFSAGESGEVIIGDRIANSVFKEPLQTGYILKINGRPFQIAGILSSSSGIGSSDNNIYMSEKDARSILNSSLSDSEYSSIELKVADASQVSEMTNITQAILVNVRHTRADKPDFSISSAEALAQRFDTLASSVTLFLGVIAAISLLVGGIGVANTMFTSVLEKTRDIGVMKAIGAKNRDILMIFLFNSGMLGLVGGLIGIFFGSLASYALPLLGISIVGAGPGGRSVHTAISLGLLIFSVAFSIIIGMASGAIPAYRASKLRPVEALRYE